VRRLVVLVVVALATVVSNAAAAPEVLVQAGQDSPLGMPFSQFSDVAVDDRGRVGFLGASAAIFERTASGLAHVASAGDVLFGRTLAGVGPPSLSSDGCRAFRVVFRGGGGGIVRDCGGGPELLAESGAAAPGGGSLAVLDPTLIVGRGGRVAFTALLTDGRTGMFVVDDPGMVTLVTRTGETAPAGGAFESLTLVGLSAAGEVGLRGTAAGGRDGLFLWNGTAVGRVAVVGEASPAGGFFTRVGFGALNDGGSWVFRATISNGVRGGIFRLDAGANAPAVVVLEDDPSPIGGTFRQFPISLLPAINSSGTIAFRAIVSGGEAGTAVFSAQPNEAPVAILTANAPTVAGRVVRFQAPVLAADGSVVVRASLAGGDAGLVVVRAGQAAPLALVTDTTDLGSGFRFTEAAAGPTAEGALFLGLREGAFVATGPGSVSLVAALGGPAPRGGIFADLQPPGGGAGRRLVFGATILGKTLREALLSAAGKPRVLVATGRRVKGRARLLDFFADPLDGGRTAGVGRRGVAFQAALNRGGQPHGVFLWGPAGVRALAREGARTPAGGRFLAFGSPAMFGGSEVAFVGLVRGGPDDDAVFVHRGRLRAVAIVGEQTRTRVPGRFRSFDSPVAGRPGIAFRATVDQNQEGLFLVSGSRIAAVAATGDPLPGGTLRGVGGATFSGRALVFVADIEGGARALVRILPGRGRSADRPPAAPAAIATVGDPSPLGGTFVGFGRPAGSRNGAVAFTAQLVDGTAAAAVLLERPPAGVDVP
jgi:hypothetical protein